MSTIERLTAGIAGLVCFSFLTIGAHAQDGLRSPVLPDRTPTQPLPAVPPVDIFRVPPSAWQQPQQPPRPWPPVSGGIYSPSPYPYPYPSPYPMSGVWSTYGPRDTAIINGNGTEVYTRNARSGYTGSGPQSRDVETRTHEYVPAPPPVRAPKKTFYIVEGCYAGDSAPDMAKLPANCRNKTIKKDER